jgi:hypothetical protein
MRLVRPDRETLIQATTLAPLGDNTRPWQFGVDGERGSSAFSVDETRDCSPMNAGQRMARIAIGSALENALPTARRNGWETTLELASPPTLAVLRLPGSAGSAGEIDDAIRARVTNRRVYEGRIVAPEQLERLRAETSVLEDVTTHWITSKVHSTTLAEWIGRADALMLGDPIMRRAFLDKLRFGQPASAAVKERLSLRRWDYRVPCGGYCACCPSFQTGC